MRRGSRLAVVLVLAVVLGQPSLAEADACPAPEQPYLDNCGPTFVLPAWGDGAGWADPSKYSTIRLADVNGDGRDELIGRDDEGIEIHHFDTTLGQWRPQVDAKSIPLVLSDFRSPLPSEEDKPNWKQPQYYSTIDAADLDGEPGEEVYGRFPDGVHAYKYVPPAGTKAIDGGSWQQLDGAGPFSDAIGGDDPSIYGSIFPGRPTGIPALLGRRRPTSDNPASLGLNGLLAACCPSLRWVFGGVIQQGAFTADRQDGDAGMWMDAVCGQPSCYLNVREARVAAQLPDPATGGASTLAPTGELLARTRFGLSAWTLDGVEQWIAVGGGADPYAGIGLSDQLGPFADVRGPDCPFSANGASGPGSGDCLGTSPSYYETLLTADIDGRVGEELLARASDGLRVKRWNGGGYDSLATLTALRGGAAVVADGLWGSIRTADINGDHKDEVLALDGNGLEAWSYDPAANAWSPVPASPKVTLLSDPWLSHPEYFATIQTGDVDGDGREDVIARGPYGVRTWFYNRRGTGGWERYLPEGYPPFPTAGQQAAFSTLTDIGHQTVGPDGTPVIRLSANSVRDMWTGKTVLAGDLTRLQQGLLSFAGCSGAKPGTPVSFQSCTPPAGSSGFSADDWKVVVNQVLSEIYEVGVVLDHFAQMGEMHEDLFVAEGAELPALRDDLQLSAASSNSATFNMQGYFSGFLSIAGSIAGVAEPEASAALFIGSTLAAMAPSASSEAMGTYQSTYADLESHFVTAAQQMDVALDAQNGAVRQDAALLTLVAQLRSRGTWNPDIPGLKSAARQAFTRWAYQALLPTLYARYVVTNCGTVWSSVLCGPPEDPGGYIAGAAGSGNFTSIGVLPAPESPCRDYIGAPTDCEFTDISIPDDVADTVWGPLSAACSYQPDNPNTGAWTFGCRLGEAKRAVIRAGSTEWKFPTYYGDPEVDMNFPGGPIALAPSQPARSAAVAAARQRTGGSLRFERKIRLPRGLRLSRARVVLDRVLHDRAGRGEAAHHRGGRPLRALTLRRTAAGLFEYGSPRDPRVQLRLRRTGGRARAMTLLIRRLHVPRAPSVCHALPASVSQKTRPAVLETRLKIRSGRHRLSLPFGHMWRCRRDPTGTVSHLVPIRPKRVGLRGGAAVSLRGPRVLHAGSTATYRVRVTNRRTGRDRLRSSLWDVAVIAQATPRADHRRWKIDELRRGRSRTFHLRVAVPAGARGRRCTTAVVVAPGVRSARADLCALVQPTIGAPGCAAVEGRAASGSGRACLRGAGSSRPQRR